MLRYFNFEPSFNLQYHDTTRAQQHRRLKLGSKLKYLKIGMKKNVKKY